MVWFEVGLYEVTKTASNWSSSQVGANSNLMLRTILLYPPSNCKPSVAELSRLPAAKIWTTLPDNVVSPSTRYGIDWILFCSGNLPVVSTSVDFDTVTIIYDTIKNSPSDRLIETQNNQWKTSADTWWRRSETASPTHSVQLWSRAECNTYCRVFWTSSTLAVTSPCKKNR